MDASSRRVYFPRLKSSATTGRKRNENNNIAYILNIYGVILWSGVHTILLNFASAYISVVNITIRTYVQASPISL